MGNPLCKCEVRASVTLHFYAAEMLVTDESEIQLQGKIRFLLWRQTDFGSSFASVINSALVLRILKTTNSPSLFQLNPAPSGCLFCLCSFLTGTVLKGVVCGHFLSLPHAAWMAAHSAPPGLLLTRARHVVPRPRSAAPWCFSVISGGVSAACSSTPHPFSSQLLLQTQPPMGFYLTPWSPFSVSLFWLQLFLSTYKRLSAQRHSGCFL